MSKFAAPHLREGCVLSKDHIDRSIDQTGVQPYLHVLTGSQHELERSITLIAISGDDSEEVTVLPLCISDLSLHSPCAIVIARDALCDRDRDVCREIAGVPSC